MVQKDLILDFNLYLCEKFGYRESYDYKYYQTLGLKCIMDGFYPNYALALKDLNV